MHNQRPSSGSNNASSYLVAGRPYLVSGKEIAGDDFTADLLFDDISAGNVIQFPSMAKKIVVRNADEGGTPSDLYVSFASLNIPDPDAGTNSAVKVAKAYWVIAPGEEMTFECKCFNIYITADDLATAATGVADVYAELTNIPRAINGSRDPYPTFTPENVAEDPDKELDQISGITSE